MVVDAAAEHRVFFNIPNLTRVQLDKRLVDKRLVGDVGVFGGTGWVLVDEADVYLVLEEVVMIRKYHDRTVLRQEISELLNLILDSFDVFIWWVCRVVYDNGTISTPNIRLIDSFVAFLTGCVPEINSQFMVFFGSHVFFPLEVCRPNGYLLPPVKQVVLHFIAVWQAAEAVAFGDWRFSNALIPQYHNFNFPWKHGTFSFLPTFFTFLKRIIR